MLPRRGYPMKRTASRLPDIFRNTKVMDFDTIRSAAPERSRRSLFRDLAAYGYLTSYTHTGRYYTLVDLPRFDEHGLWLYQGIGFSRVGTLKETLVHLVHGAKAGHTHHELEAMLHIRVHNTLFGLLRDKRIGRKQIEKLYVYVSTDARNETEQLTQRREMPAKATEDAGEMPEAMVIEVLIEVVRAGKRVFITPPVLTERLQARGILVSVAQVERVFVRHGLAAQKKTAPSLSRHSRH